MANTNHTQNQQQLDQCGLIHERRSAHYKPNIWSYDFVQSLTTKFSVSILLILSNCCYYSVKEPTQSKLKLMVETP